MDKIKLFQGTDVTMGLEISLRIISSRDFEVIRITLNETLYLFIRRSIRFVYSLCKSV